MARDPQFEWLYDMAVDVELPPRQVGDVGRGSRVVVALTGGRFEGPRLGGRVLPGGGDWALVRADGTAELDVRGTLETHDGALLYLTYRGYLTRAPEVMPRWLAGEAIPHEEHYLAATPYFETAAPQYSWLMQTVFVGLGTLVPGGVRYRVYAVT
jgi:hypothetical protein